MRKNITLGNIEPTRDFNFVSDVIDAFIKVMRSKKTVGQVVNVGSNKKISVLKLCNEIFKLIDKRKKITIDQIRKRPKLSEVDNLQGNYKKIKKLTNWTPQTELTEGLKKTIDWLKRNKIDNLNNYIV